MEETARFITCPCCGVTQKYRAHSKQAHRAMNSGRDLSLFIFSCRLSRCILSHISRLEFIFRFILPGAVRPFLRVRVRWRASQRTLSSAVVCPPSPAPTPHYHDSGLPFIVSGDAAFSLSFTRFCTFLRAPIPAGSFTAPGESHW